MSDHAQTVYVSALIGRYRRTLAVVAILALAWILRVPLMWCGAEFALGFGNLAHAIILIPLLQRFRGFWYMNLDWQQVEQYFGDHIRLVLKGMVIAIAVAIPVGVLIHRVRALYLPTFVLLDGIYALPSLAIFPILFRYTGLSDATVLIPMVGYAQFILVRNVVAGLELVPPQVKEAARGMGMNRAQILFRIELPLAMPVIVAGVRIATVAAIGIAAIAAFVAIPDLGSLFQTAQNGGVNSYAEAEAGAVAVMVVAVGADLILRGVEHFVPANRVARAGRRGLIRVSWGGVGDLLASAHIGQRQPDEMAIESESG